MNPLFVSLLIAGLCPYSFVQATATSPTGSLRVGQLSIAAADTKVLDAAPRQERGTWRGQGYHRHKAYESDYDEAYAAEVTRYLRLQLENDHVQIAECDLEVHTYPYATELKRYDEESVFITHYQPPPRAGKLCDRNRG